MDSNIQNLSKELKSYLTEAYGDRLAALILFGSYARGDFHQDSDVDFLVVLNDEKVAGGSEITYMTKTVSSISLKYSKLVSILPVSRNRYKESILPFYQKVRFEGISI